jgi:hypothetical protein
MAANRTAAKAVKPRKRKRSAFDGHGVNQGLRDLLQKLQASKFCQDHYPSRSAIPRTADRDLRVDRKEWRTAREERGVPEVTTHSFRKTVATLIDDEGCRRESAPTTSPLEWISRLSTESGYACRGSKRMPQVLGLSSARAQRCRPGFCQIGVRRPCRACQVRVRQ